MNTFNSTFFVLEINTLQELLNLFFKMAIRSILFYLLIVLSLCNCSKENCEETYGRNIKLKIYSQNNENVTTNYELDSVFIYGNCPTPGLNPANGYPFIHRDTMMEFALGRCCFSDSIKYFIALNNRFNRVDSFYTKQIDFNECNNCSILEAAPYSLTNEFIDNGLELEITIFE